MERLQDICVKIMQAASALDFNGIITSKSNKGFETLICFSRGKCCKIIKSEGLFRFTLSQLEQAAESKAAQLLLKVFLLELKRLKFVIMSKKDFFDSKPS